jgi:hypothetical protein
MQGFWPGDTPGHTIHKTWQQRLGVYIYIYIYTRARARSVFVCVCVGGGGSNTKLSGKTFVKKVRAKKGCKDFVYKSCVSRGRSITQHKFERTGLQPEWESSQDCCEQHSPKRLFTLHGLHVRLRACTLSHTLMKMSANRTSYHPLPP